ncbi:methyl-CpG-binding domain protein 1a isoform X3 [Electrophorus electricus]|uniref:methyl-CpG-binding domain protein 1a isoform X3 n=1 Tax=Electrophorus electricus TaxID=8005 RepID=UPI0015D0CC6F|nr:methyl-CpG-binding domain protein 1a isoform X3 [Electrophorus electricus]
MGDMAEDSKGRSVGEQDEATPVLQGDVLPNTADAAALDEPPRNWLEPLEEDYEEEGEEGVESDRSSERSGRRTHDSLRRRRQQHEDWERNWLDCPDLGQGWKRKEVFRRSGSTMGKIDTYYKSPKGHRFRSKIELAKHVMIDLTHFDYRQGTFVDSVVTTKRRRTDAPEDGARSSLSSSRTATPDPDTTRTPDRLTPTPPAAPCNKVSTPQRPQLTPNLPVAAEASLPPNQSFGSPPELTRVSLASPQSADAQQASRSPSLRLGSFSPQALSLVTTSGKGEITSLPQSWLQSSLTPVSPLRTPDSETPIHLFGQSEGKHSPNFPLPPRTQLALDPETTINREIQHHDLPPLDGCANCGCEYPGMGNGQDLLCPKCRQKKRPSPHIVFRKVGQDKWVLGKTRMEDPLKKKISPLGKKHHSSQAVPQDSDHDDYAPDAGDDDESGPKRRNRRMCGQCKACLQDNDCGECDFCMDKPKFGGRNKKRQKCRMRQCQFQSRHQNRHGRQVTLADTVKDSPRIFRKRGRPPGKRAIKWRSWDGDFTDDEDDDEDEDMHQRTGEPQSSVRKWRYSFGHEDNEEMVEPEIEDEGPGDLEQAFMVCEDGSKGFFESEGLYSNSYSLSAQNGAVTVLETIGDQNGMVLSQPRPQELFYTMAGLSEGSQVLGTIRLTSSGSLQLSDVPGRAGPRPTSDVLSASGPLQLSEVLSRSGLELISMETSVPQLLPAREQDPGPAPEPRPDPEPPETMPVIAQTYSLADSAESESAQDQGLLDLLRALRSTVLPAHWVGVMAKGPLLQLFQCSKISPMADTVLQIEAGFFYQISVQSQPLLPTHVVYEGHPPRLTTVEQVVALLLDLERMAVCQGCQSFESCPARGPVLCTRAALCALLIPQDDEHCAKCQPPTED